MDGARTNAPDLFAALAWAQRRSPIPSAAEAQATAPTIERSSDPHAITPPDGVAALDGPPPPVTPRVPAPPRRGTPVAPPPAPGFGGLADMLEPSGEESPALDEFESMLEDLEAPVDPIAPTQAPIDAPRRATPAATAPRRGTPVAPVPAPRPPIAPPRASRAAPAAIPRPATIARADAPAAIDFPAPGDPAVSAQLVAPVAEAHDISRVAAVLDDEAVAPRRSSGLAWVWITLTVMLAGALGWVLYTQTDIFSGDVIGNRNAEAVAEAVREHEAKQAEIAAKARQYGTIELETTPKGARVFDMRDGPETAFVGLPPEHEYLVLVAAAGHVPRIRRIKGSELAAPVIVDLDPLPAGAPEAELPDEEPPKLATTLGKQTATLTLRSNTPGAQLGLLVGYTPGVKLVDVDVAEPKRFWIALPGFEREELVVKGRHYEELAAGSLVFSTNVQLRERTPVEGDDAIVVDDDATAPPPSAAVPPAPTKAAAPVKASVKKKKKAKKKKRSKRRR